MCHRKASIRASIKFVVLESKPFPQPFQIPVTLFIQIYLKLFLAFLVVLVKTNLVVLVNCRTTTLAIIFWSFTVLWCCFELPQVQRVMISSIMNLVNRLPHELPNDLTLAILENLEIVPESRNEFMAIAIKNYKKEDVKVFWGCSILLGFSLLGRYFCHDCSRM